jgi:L-2-hydroxyglutarate oxidase
VPGCCQRAPVRWMDAVQVRDCARASGVRALVVGVYGALLDDFVVQAPAAASTCTNAPSPAATTALEIARYVAAQLAETLPYVISIHRL